MNYTCLQEWPIFEALKLQLLFQKDWTSVWSRNVFLFFPHKMHRPISKWVTTLLYQIITALKFYCILYVAIVHLWEENGLAIMQDLCRKQNLQVSFANFCIQIIFSKCIQYWSTAVYIDVKPVYSAFVILLTSSHFSFSIFFFFSESASILEMFW